MYSHYFTVLYSDHVFLLYHVFTKSKALHLQISWYNFDMLLKEINPMLRNMIIRTIRQWFSMSDKHKEVKNKVRVEKPIIKKDGTISAKKSVSYRCNKCSDLFKSNEIHVDHITTVVPQYGESSTMTLMQYIKAVDCPLSNLQVLCVGCHKAKTKVENSNRRKKDRTGKPLKKYKKPIKKPNKIKF